MKPETFETVLERCMPYECPGNPERFKQACKEAAAHVKAKTFKGDPQQRKLAMLKAGLRFRNEWFAKEPA